ncbi:MAG: hypothetical protein RIS04_202 [Pseudomonadota bacterium]|jgi:hypothetical protein
MMIKKSLLTVTMGLALLATSAAHAQMGSPMSGEGHAMHMQGHKHGHKNESDRMHKRDQHRMDKLKQSLKLSTDQNQAWTSFEASLKSQGMQRPDPQTIAKMTTPERLDFMSKMKTQRDVQMQKRQDATLALYSSLSPEQKKTFDQETLAFMKHHEHGGRHMGKGGQHH